MESGVTEVEDPALAGLFDPSDAGAGDSGALFPSVAAAGAGTMPGMADVHCSFCGKSTEAVEKVIAGPEGVYICNECVMLCVDILGEELQGGTGSVA